MSIELKGATDFLRSLATATEAMANALERAGVVLHAHQESQRPKPQRPKPQPPALPGRKSATDAEMMQWMRKNALPGCSWDKAVADYICYKEGSLLRPESKGPSVSYKLKPERDSLADLAAAEQDDLAKDAAEYNSIPPQVDGRPAVDTTAMAMEISRKKITSTPKTREEIIATYKMAKAEPTNTEYDAAFGRLVEQRTQPLPIQADKMQIDVFNNILSSGATVEMGVPDATRPVEPVISVAFIGAHDSGKSTAVAQLFGKENPMTQNESIRFAPYVNAKQSNIMIIDAPGMLPPMYVNRAKHCILFSDAYLTQEQLDSFTAGTHFKRFTTQEKLKEYLDSL